MAKGFTSLTERLECGCTISKACHIILVSLFNFPTALAHGVGAFGPCNCGHATRWDLPTLPCRWMDRSLRLSLRHTCCVRAYRMLSLLLCKMQDRHAHLCHAGASGVID